MWSGWEDSKGRTTMGGVDSSCSATVTGIGVGSQASNRCGGIQVDDEHNVAAEAGSSDGGDGDGLTANEW